MVRRLGDLIRAKRESMGHSYRGFAEICHLSHTYIKNLEDGDPKTGKDIIPSIECLRLIAPVLGMSLEDLLTEIGYIRDKKFEFSNLKLIRGSKTHGEITKDIAASTGEKIDPSLYKAVEEGGDTYPTYLFINALAKYAGVNCSFFYKENTVRDWEYAKVNAPYQYPAPGKELLSHIKDIELKEFIGDPAVVDYLRLAKDLYERKIKVKLVRDFLFEE